MRHQPVTGNAPSTAPPKHAVPGEASQRTGGMTSREHGAVRAGLGFRFSVLADQEELQSVATPVTEDEDGVHPRMPTAFQKAKGPMGAHGMVNRTGGPTVSASHPSLADGLRPLGKINKQSPQGPSAVGSTTNKKPVLSDITNKLGSEAAYAKGNLVGPLPGPSKLGVNIRLRESNELMRRWQLSKLLN